MVIVAQVRTRCLACGNWAFTSSLDKTWVLESCVTRGLGWGHGFAFIKLSEVPAIVLTHVRNALTRAVTALKGKILWQDEDENETLDRAFNLLVSTSKVTPHVLRQMEELLSATVALASTNETEKSSLTSTLNAVPLMSKSVCETFLMP